MPVTMDPGNPRHWGMSQVLPPEEARAVAEAVRNAAWGFEEFRQAVADAYRIPERLIWRLPGDYSPVSEDAMRWTPEDGEADPWQ